MEAGKATQFAPGRSGNLSGRPSTRVLTEELRKGLASRIPAELASELTFLFPFDHVGIYD